jgi:hypothetical protein
MELALLDRERAYPIRLVGIDERVELGAMPG